MGDKLFEIVRTGKDELFVRRKFIIIVKYGYPPERVCRKPVHPVRRGGLLCGEIKTVFDVFYRTRSVEKSECFGVKVAYPHKTVALNAVPDHSALQTEEKGSLRNRINFVYPFVVTAKTADYFMIFGYALRVNALNAVFTRFEFETDKSEPRLPVSSVRKLRKIKLEISKRMVVRRVFNAYRGNRFA